MKTNIVTTNPHSSQVVELYNKADRLIRKNKEISGKIFIASQGLPCCHFFFPVVYNQPETGQEFCQSSTVVAFPSSQGWPVSYCRQRGSPCYTELPEAKTPSGGDLPLSHHKSQQWNRCWGSLLQHMTRDKHVTAAYLQEKPFWYLCATDREREAAIVNLPWSYWVHVQGTEQSVWHKACLSRMLPCHSLASQSIWPSA